MNSILSNAKKCLKCGGIMHWVVSVPSLNAGEEEVWRGWLCWGKPDNTFGCGNREKFNKN